MRIAQVSVASALSAVLVGLIPVRRNSTHLSLHTSGGFFLLWNHLPLSNLLGPTEKERHSNLPTRCGTSLICGLLPIFHINALTHTHRNHILPHKQQIASTDSTQNSRRKVMRNLRLSRTLSIPAIVKSTTKYGRTNNFLPTCYATTRLIISRTFETLDFCVRVGRHYLLSDFSN